jgi:hypothetical protein
MASTVFARSCLNVMTICPVASEDVHAYAQIVLASSRATRHLIATKNRAEIV